jgi:cytosine permease
MAEENTMSSQPLPSYLASARPNPLDKRGPWYMNTAPSYAGIFLWIAFYDQLGKTLQVGGLWAALIGLLLAALISYFLFYRVFGLLGMRTGYPLYVVGSSTFGTKGGYIFPGIFMGLLQIGWYSVATFYSAKLVLQALGVDAAMTKTVFDPDETLRGFSIVFIVVAAVWGYIFATVGALGIQYVAKVSQFFPIVPLIMLVIAAIGGASGLEKFEPAGENLSTLAAMGLMIQLVIGFFATAGAAGVDFGLNSRHEKDVSLGGLTGIALAAFVAGGLALLTVAGAHGLDPKLTSFSFAGSLGTASPALAKVMFLLFAIGSMAPACFCSFIIGNSLSTMIPSVPRMTWTLGGATIGIVLAALGLAGNLASFFGLIGASFGPICGAMVADYLLSGRKWAGPRAGVSIPGYVAWIIGFLVGICNNAMVTRLLGDREILSGSHPTAVYSFVVGFVVYAVLAKAGLLSKPVSLPTEAAQA